MPSQDREFAYLAHDLSQLLWAIQGRARLLADRLPAAEAASADMIAEHAAAAASMLADRTPARPLADLPATATRAWHQARDQIAAQGLTVTCAWQGPGDAPPVAVPEWILRRILGNLFANALEAQAGGGWLECDVQVEDGAVVLTVRDGGPGIADAMRAHLFEPGTSGSAGSGRGLGLAGARDLARRWGGDLVLSATAAGAAFGLRLPTSPGADTMATPAPTVEAAVSTALRLLVVDDEAAVTEMLAELLAAEGHEVTVAMSNDEARALFVAGRFEVALIDLGLPDGPGDALASVLRAADPTLAVVLLTGWGREDDLAGCAADVVDLTAVKPLDLPHLRQTLAQAGRLASKRRRAREGED